MLLVEVGQAERAACWSLFWQGRRDLTFRGGALGEGLRAALGRIRTVEWPFLAFECGRVTHSY